MNNKPIICRGSGRPAKGCSKVAEYRVDNYGAAYGVSTAGYFCKAHVDEALKPNRPFCSEANLHLNRLKKTAMHMETAEVYP